MTDTSQQGPWTQFARTKAPPKEEGPWTQYSNPEGGSPQSAPAEQGPWTQFERTKEPPALTPKAPSIPSLPVPSWDKMGTSPAKPAEKGIYAGAKGALSGAISGLKSGATESNPLELTPEQTQAALQTPGPTWIKSLSAVPSVIGNVMGYGTNLAIAGVGGAIGGGIAGYEGASDAEKRNITAQAEREFGGIMDSEMGRVGEPHGSKGLLPAKAAKIEEVKAAPWEQFKRPERAEGFSSEPVPQSAGAAAAPSAPPLPERPSTDLINTQDDRFFRLKGAATADKAEFVQRVEAMPELIRNPKIQEKLYRYMEGDSSVKLTPEEKAAYEDHIAPLKREERDLFEEVKKSDLDVGDYDPEYVHRIVKGRAPQFEAFAGDSSRSNPIGGTQTLPKATSSMKDRVFYAIEDPQGVRRTVAIKDGNMALAGKNGTFTPLKPSTFGGTKPKEIRPGETVTVGGKPWTVKNALTPEIEAATGTMYHKNAVANTIDNVARLRSVARAIHETERLKASPEFKAYAKPYGEKNIPNDWRETTMPTFRGYLMDPKLANVIDDFYGKRSKGATAEMLAKVNRFAVGSLFWSPVPHALNAGGHWFTARGWDWITPKGVKSLALDSAIAMKEVITQGPKYQQLLREGSGLIYGGLANREFYETMMKRLGEDVKRQPDKWDPIARVLGVSPVDLVRMMYNGAARSLWSVSDMFMMQRVLELERKGMSTRAAIREAERHIPNYRIPPEVLGSRAINEVLTNPIATEFSRYHYGMLKSYAHMAKDLAVGDAKQKFEALGNIMATAFLMTVVWPVVNYGIQKLTGSNDLTLGPKGSTTIPQNLIDLWNGDKGFTEVLSGLVTIGPAIRTGLESFPSNLDWFTGRHIREPGDERSLRYGRVAAQQAEHIAENLVQPYSMVAQAERSGRGLVKGVLAQGLGLKFSGPEQKAKKEKAFKAQEKESRKRQKKPRGPIEDLAYKVGL